MKLRAASWESFTQLCYRFRRPHPYFGFGENFVLSIHRIRAPRRSYDPSPFEAKNFLGLFIQVFFAAHRERRLDQLVAGEEQPPKI